MKIILNIAISLIVTFVLASCSSHRGVVKDASGGTAPVSGSTAALYKRAEKMVNGYGQWRDVRMPVTLEINSPASATLNGTLTMVRGKDIHLSLRVPLLGMEVMTAYVTADSVYATVKPTKQYLAEDIDSFFRNFPVTVNNVQDLLLGRLFVVGDNSVTASGIKELPVAAGAGDTFTVSPAAVEGIGYSFTVDAAGNVSRVTVTPGGGASPVSCVYSDVTSAPVGKIATEASVKARAGNATIDATLVIKLSKTEWNKGNTRSWQAPKGYKRVTASQLVGMIKNFSF